LMAPNIAAIPSESAELHGGKIVLAIAILPFQSTNDRTPHKIIGLPKNARSSNLPPPTRSHSPTNNKRSPLIIRKNRPPFSTKNLSHSSPPTMIAL
jgi:hypothetical protein